MLFLFLHLLMIDTIRVFWSGIFILFLHSGKIFGKHFDLENTNNEYWKRIDGKIMAYQKVLADLEADSTPDEAHSFDMSQLPFEEKKSLYRWQRKKNYQPKDEECITRNDFYEFTYVLYWWSICDFFWNSSCVSYT